VKRVGVRRVVWLTEERLALGAERGEQKHGRIWGWSIHGQWRRASGDVRTDVAE